MTERRHYCDRITRRNALRVGLGGAAAGALGLRGLDAADRPARDDVSLIILFLQGGLSTIDTLDMKPEAPAEFRGEFDPIDTNVPGIRVCEHLPGLATVADRFTLLRNFTHTNSGHGPADHWMLTGYATRAGFNGGLKPNNQFPSHGSIIAHELGPRGSVPPYVCLPKMHNSAGSAFLGPSSAPFVVDADPNAPGFTVPNLLPPLEVDADRLDDRRGLLATVDRYRESAEVEANAGARSIANYKEKAFELVASRETREAFDIGLETNAVRDAYGRHSLGQSCLLARRLVEAGVRCVTIDHTNWDTHYNNFSVLRTDLLPHLDTGLPALLRDLADRGRLESTLVCVMGEFGRTPRVNKDAGRDHWGPANCLLLAGGGIAGGRVVGATNPRGEKPDTDPVGPEDLAATLHHLLGIDGEKLFETPEGRPVKIVNDGRVIQSVLT